MEKKKNSPLNKKIAQNKPKDFEFGSNNIFADLGFPNPEEELAKSELAIQIYHLIKQKKLSQAKAAVLLGVDQAKVSALMTGKLSGFSIERLFRFLNALGQDVAIRVKPTSRTQAKRRTTVGSSKPMRREIGDASRGSRAYSVHAKKRS